MRFRLGINYWPTSSAMDWWKRFDAGEVEADWAQIREAGFDSVRIFLLWEDFQPVPIRVSDEALARLVQVADAAARSGLSLMPTLFTGHMSGVNWIPEWVHDSRGTSRRFRIVSDGKIVNGGIKNWYADEEVIRAQVLLARETARALYNHPALWAWDLGNESSSCVVPPSRDAAVAWLERMAGAIRSVDPKHPITLGLGQEDVEQTRPLGPVEAGRVCEFLCMHGYPMYAPWSDDPADTLVLPFLGLITRWLAGRDVLFQEFGMASISHNDIKALAAASSSSIPLVPEDSARIFAKRSLAALHRSGFMGAMVWCFGDYVEALWNKPPFDTAVHERYFGLWRADHTAKPAVSEIKQWKDVERQLPWNDFSWIDLRTDQFSSNPIENLRRLYREFRKRFSEYLY